MFLKQLAKEMQSFQMWYQWRTTLYALEKIDISNKEWRMLLILEILKYAKSLNLNVLNDWNTIPDIKLISSLITECKTYYYNNVIVKWKFTRILQELSFEIIKENNWKFDFSLIKEIWEWKKSISDFLYEAKDKHPWNTLYSFIWESGKVYSGKWTWDLMKLKWDEVLDILKIENTKPLTERLQAWMNYYFNEANKDDIKKRFSNSRVAWLSIINEILNEDIKSKLVDFAVSKSEETKETKAETWKAPF